MSKETLEKCLHELTTLNGLFCTDLVSETGSNHFRLDLEWLIDEVKEELSK